MVAQATFSRARVVARPPRHRGTQLFQRETALRQAISLLRRWRERMRMRRQARNLCELDDYVLQDIGLTRAELLWEAAKPYAPRRVPGARQLPPLCIAAVIAAAILPLEISAAQAQLVRAQDAASLLGAERAQGVVIWSHGRSLVQESSLDPTPEYIDAFRAAGWDTFRLNRPSITDTLTASAAALADEAEALKRSGYRRVVLAGQSFGAFISLIAAGHSDAVDTVIGTAPAAYGSAQSNPMGYILNATRLYDLLGAVRRARVALFFFKGDIFDPGGRGPMADQVLAAHGLAHLVVDRPAGLRTHWAGAGAAFAEEFAPCLVAFAAGNGLGDTLDCRNVGSSARRAGMERSPTPPALRRRASYPPGNSVSVIDLQIGRREDVVPAVGGR